MPHLFRFRSWLSLTKLVSCLTLVPAFLLPETGFAQSETPPAVGVSLTPLASPPAWETLKKYDGVLTREEFLEALEKVYQQPNAPTYEWKLDDQAILLDTGLGRPPLELKFKTPEYQSKTPIHSLRYWRTAKELPTLEEGDPVLKGLNIALDPGHIGGAFAKMEERHISIGEGKAVKEGDLMLELARLLKPRLEALGATVTLVRSDDQPVTSSRAEDFLLEAEKVLHQGGISSPAKDYTQDMGEQKVTTIRWQSEKLFYRVAEIRARAKKVNEQIRPDLVLALHLNAEAWGDSANPTLTPNNHYHMIVNGCYSKTEMGFADIRFDMLHRMYQKISAEEVALASTLSKALQEKTQLPGYKYTSPTARSVEGDEFTWARNLLANRLYQCPVVYYEPYLMNHEDTHHALLLGHFIGRTWHREKWVTSPLENYARGVVEGLKRHYSTHRRLPREVKP